MDVARTHEATLANMQQFSGDASSISHVSRSRRTHEPSGRREEAPTCAKYGRHHAPTDRCPTEGSRCKHVGNSITGSEYVGRLQVGRLAQEEDDTLLGDQDPELGQDEGPTEMSVNEVVSTPSVRTPYLNSSATTSSRLLIIPSTSMPSRGTRYMRLSGSR